MPIYKCTKEECNTPLNEHCRCIMISEREPHGCLFGRGGEHYAASFEVTEIDTIRDTEFECGECDEHCRLAFDVGEFLWSPCMWCPKEPTEFINIYDRWTKIEQ